MRARSRCSGRMGPGAYTDFFTPVERSSADWGILRSGLLNETKPCESSIDWSFRPLPSRFGRVVATTTWISVRELAEKPEPELTRVAADPKQVAGPVGSSAAAVPA